MAKLNHQPLTYLYPGLVKAIRTPVELFFGISNVRYMVHALWDTGAMISAVTPSVVKKLGLQKVDVMKIIGANSTNDVDVVLISIIFPNQVIIKNLRVAVCTIHYNTEMIIGMDIITQMDVAICNSGKQTQFSFVTPPYKRKVDFEKMTE